jgi:hypothetical protein
MSAGSEKAGSELGAHLVIRTEDLLPWPISIDYLRF